MNSLRWSFSLEHFSGVLAGFGVGVITTNALLSSPEHHVIINPFAYMGAWLSILLSHFVRALARKRATTA